MTLRKIHQNLIQIHNHNHTQVIQNFNSKQSVSYDEQQPPHPKIIADSPVKFNNSKITQDFWNSGGKSATTRQKTRQRIEKNLTGKFTALNTSRKSKFQVQGPSNKNSPRQTEYLFVPQRKKFSQRNKLAEIKKQCQLKKLKINNSVNKISSVECQMENKEELQRQTNYIQKIKLIQPNKTIHHISHLRKYQNEQKHRESLLSNRINFITLGNQKDNKKLQMVKRKFQKVVLIRSEFRNQKEKLNKTKRIVQQGEWKNKFSKVSSVKQQKQQRRLSVSRLSQGKSLQASRIREQQKRIERQILTNKLKDLQRKKEEVKNAHTSIEKSRQRISQMNSSRISSIRSVENKSLIRSYVNAEKRDKINQKLYENLQREIKLINERKLKGASQLKQYESMLGIHRKSSREVSLLPKDKARISVESPCNKMRANSQKLQRAVSSTFNSSGPKSFYLTNY